jgi:hypothetical protein
MKRPVLTWTSVLCTGALEGLACAWPFAVDAAGWPAMLGLHAAAAAFSVLAGHLRNPTLSPAERDAVLLCAALVPLAGPLLAWAIPRREGERAELDAHSAFELRRLDEGVDVGFSPRTTFTGDFLHDLSRRIDARSHAEVLHDGTLQEKRAAIRRLCELGEPRHLALVRSVLANPEDELRLVAYAELRRIEAPYEERLRTARAAAHAADAPAERWTALAQALLGYARSGVLDRPFAAHHLDGAATAAARALDAGDRSAACAAAGLAALVELERVEEAHAWLAGFAPDVREERAVRTVRAELAWRERDLSGARRLAAGLAAEGEIADWMRALLPRDARRESGRAA